MTRSKILLAAVALTAAIPMGAQARPSTDSLVFETGTGVVEITPGLCLPGDVAPSCVGPYQAQFRVAFQTCAINGRFEGIDLPVNAACGGANFGFTFGSLPGWTKPACGNTHSYSSNETTAWGPGNRNTHTIGTTVRDEFIEIVANAGGMLAITGWIDDEDADLDPVGDHSILAFVNLQPVSEPGGRACATHPATRLTFTSAGMFG